MDKKEFAPILKKLSYAYNRPDLREQGAAEAWYSFFDKFSAEVFDKTVTSYILTKQKAPTISDLIMQCRDLEAKEKRKNNV